MQHYFIKSYSSLQFLNGKLTHAKYLTKSLKDHFWIKWYQSRLIVGCFLVCMINRENLSHGEGEIVEGDPEIGSIKWTY
jgi:hypothetical protein